MPFRRRQLKTPGGPRLDAKRDLYIELMSKGLSNSAACRTVGVNRRSGTRWRRGRTIVNRAGNARTYAPIIDQPGGTTERFLSEAERFMIADGILAGMTVRAIAAVIGRSPSTVSREIRRNSDPVTHRYLPFGAHRRDVEGRRRSKEGKIARNPNCDASSKTAWTSDGAPSRSPLRAPSNGWRSEVPRVVLCPSLQRLDRRLNRNPGLGAVRGYKTPNCRRTGSRSRSSCPLSTRSLLGRKSGCPGS
jgi:Helix-turn-helix domain